MVRCAATRNGHSPMALATYFDYETTGKLGKGWKITQSSLPFLPFAVQLAAVLADSETAEVKESFDVLIKPEGYDSMPSGAQEIHGISYERAMDEGIPKHEAIEMFKDFVDRSVGVVAHNFDYDGGITKIECARLGLDPIWFTMKPSFCTMKQSTDICKLPGMWPGAHKWPQLKEVLQVFFNEELEGAHNALYDVAPLPRVHVFIKQFKRGLVKLPSRVAR